ncbi:hypothetical protein VTJ83DRAFT_201 [Remersonia thermophila]|uniref:Uncharacterized protein n=1 Tax=Remersonia thermophila TaxID=72144 RepID=A0ABR4DKB4_9PEZI
METQARSRPVLEPVRTTHEQYPASSRPSITVTAPTPAPTPVHPASSQAYEQAMRAHERALLDRLDRLDRLEQHERRDSVHTPAAARSMPPTSPQQSLDARRASTAALPPPRTPAVYAQHPRPQTLADRTRQLLLDGMADGLPRLSPPRVDDGRAFLPPLAGTFRRSSGQHVRDELQEWGHVCLGNAVFADCYVSAVALRRHSDSSSADEGAAAREPPSDGRNRVTIRARVRPGALDRKPFLLRRTFDMDQLRATVPDRTPSPTASRRLSNPLGRQNPGRRSSAAAAGIRQATGVGRSHVQATNTVPVDLQYAKAFFPVLAALLYSGHIHRGDIVDLPMPFPEVWAQTVAHVYTGQGDLTEPMRQNIVYLGGKA